MKWFALQRGIGHKVEPVLFHVEKPASIDWQRRIISGTLREVPKELENASLEALATWAGENGRI